MFKDRLRWKVVGWLCFVVLLSYMDRVNFSMAAPMLMEELGLSPTQLGICLSGFTIGYTLLNFPGGFMAQRYSSRKLISIILVLWSLMTFATALVSGFALLMVVRILFGACEGPMAPAITKVVNGWALPKERGMVTGLWIAAMPAGVIVGNMISGYVITMWGWRSIFYIFGLGGVVLGFFLWRAIRDNPGQHPDISHAELELIESQNEAATATGQGSSMKTLLKDPYIYLISLIYFAFIINAWAAQTWLPTYFVKARGSSLLSSGFYSSLPWVVAVVGCVTLGWFSDKTNRWRSPWLAIALFSIVPSTIYAVYSPSLIGCLIGFSVSLYFSFGIASVAWAYVMDTYPAEDVAKVSGMMLAAGSFSGVVAPTLIGVILDKTGEFNYAYYSFAAMAFIGGILCFFLIARERKVRAAKQAAEAAMSGMTAAANA